MADQKITRTAVFASELHEGDYTDYFSTEHGAIRTMVIEERIGSEGGFCFRGRDAESGEYAGFDSIMGETATLVEYSYPEPVDPPHSHPHADEVEEATSSEHIGELENMEDDPNYEPSGSTLLEMYKRGLVDYDQGSVWQTEKGQMELKAALRSRREQAKLQLPVVVQELEDVHSGLSNDRQRDYVIQCVRAAFAQEANPHAEAYLREAYEQVAREILGL